MRKSSYWLYIQIETVTLLLHAKRGTKDRRIHVRSAVCFWDFERGQGHRRSDIKGESITGITFHGSNSDAVVVVVTESRTGGKVSCFYQYMIV